jgi:hypothetical protein
MVRILTILSIIGLFGCASREHSQTSKPAHDSHEAIPDGHVLIVREVRAPGVYPWTNGMRLTDAISCAGGVTEFARHITIFHSDGTREAHKYDRILERPSANPLLKPRDFIHIYAPIL